MKKIIYIGLWVVFFLGTIALLSASKVKQGSKICEELQIKIDTKSGMHFITNDDISVHLRKMNMNPIGKPMSEVSIEDLEKTISTIPEIKNAEVYSTIDGKIGIEIEQRVPVVRVIKNNGSSFYIDEDGYQMKVSEKYYPRLLVVTGYVSDETTDLSARRIALDPIKSKSFKMDDIFKLVRFINKDKFWKAQIQQIDITRSGEIELIPTAGDHRIIFGTLENMEGKFNKLFIFYKEGLSNAGWEFYKTVNVKYKHQIICTKK